MTDLQRNDREDTVHIDVGTWVATSDRRPAYRFIVTLDPQAAQEAWTKLSTYAPALEFQALHQRLHTSLVKAIRTSESLNKRKESEVNERGKASATLKSLRSAGL